MIAPSGTLPRLLQPILTFVSAVLALTVSIAAQAQQGEVVRRGDAVVTGFSGTIPPGPDLPADMHPLDRTYLDLDGVTARIFDLTQLGGGPTGQLAEAPIRLSLKARQVGHVFGIAFDGDGVSGPPNIYLSATSVYGLQIVMPKDQGYPERVMTGRPGAKWMPGLWGDKTGPGSPGTIWKVDGRTGAVTPFAEIKNGDFENSGAGLGSMAFDARSRHLYVSDMETGLIWRLALDGRIIDAFDHGTVGRAAAGLPMSPYNPASRVDKTSPSFNTDSPDTWGFADPERRVWGLAVENDRLYYSVADGPKIWSVALNPDGSFGDDARLELDVTGTPAGNMISSIMFDGAGIMYLAQRGTHLGNYDYAAFSKPQEAMVMRYRWNEVEGRWAEAYEEYSIGLKHEHRASLGGVALNYGYDRFGNIDYGRCRETLWTTGEHLREGSDIVRVTNGGPRLVHGVQGNYKSRVRPDNAPPFESWFIDYDAKYEDVESHGHIGNVGIFGPCERGVTTTHTEAQIPVWTRGPNVVVEKRCFSGVLGGKVRCEIVVRNKGDAVAGDIIQIVDETRVLWGPGSGTLVKLAAATPDGPEWICEINANGDYACRIPGDLLGPGAERRIEVWVDTRDLILAGNVGFRNCVTLRHPHGRNKACSEGGAEIIVKKTAPLECKPGLGCSFDITVTNAGLTPFEGEVLLADSVFVNGQPANLAITSIAPALGCASEPAQLPFSCVSQIALGPGESRTHKITVQMPAPGGYWAQNCFGVAEPWVAADAVLIGKLLSPVKFKAGGAPPGGYPSCVWVKIPGPQEKVLPQSKGPGVYIPLHGHSSQLVPPGYTPPEYVCEDGRPPTASGRCPCPLYAPYNPETGRCGYRQVCWDKARLRNDGTCCPWGTVYWAGLRECRPPPYQGCSDISRRAADGSCCPLGFASINGVCRRIVVERPCGWNEFRNNWGECVRIPAFIPIPIPGRTGFCLDGRPRLPNGSCPSIQCPPGRQFSPRTGHCEVIKVGVPVPIGPVKCPLNFVPNAKGECLPRVGQPQTTPCGPGQVRNILGRCGVPSGPGTTVCAIGTRPEGGKCVGIKVPLVPPTKTGSPIVTPFLPGGPCPQAGFVRDPKGNCIPSAGNRLPPRPGDVKGPVTPPVVGCPGNLVRNAQGACVPPGVGKQPPVVGCPGNLVRNAQGACVPPGVGKQPPVVGCPGNLVRNAQGACVPPGVGKQPPVVNQPPLVKQPPVIKQPVPKQPLVKQPVVKPPVAKQPVVKQPVVKQPVQRRPPPPPKLKPAAKPVPQKTPVKKVQPPKPFLPQKKR